MQLPGRWTGQQLRSAHVSRKVGKSAQELRESVARSRHPPHATVEKSEEERRKKMNPFQSKKAIWWAVGVGILIAGIFAAAVILPLASKPYGADAPDISVPNMRNAPEQPGTHRLDLEVTEEKEEK